MNKIYKVIWSKVKNSYVVTSEFAKSNAKCSSNKNISKAVTAGILASILGCGAILPSAVFAAAADTVTSSKDNATKLFLLGHTAAGTAAAKYDSGVYITETAGQLHVGSLESKAGITGTTGTFSGLVTGSGFTTAGNATIGSDGAGTLTVGASGKTSGKIQVYGNETVTGSLTAGTLSATNGGANNFTVSNRLDITKILNLGVEKTYSELMLNDTVISGSAFIGNSNSPYLILRNPTADVNTISPVAISIGKTPIPYVKGRGNYDVYDYSSLNVNDGDLNFLDGTNIVMSGSNSSIYFTNTNGAISNKNYYFGGSDYFGYNFIVDNQSQSNYSNNVAYIDSNGSSHINENDLKGMNIASGGYIESVTGMHNSSNAVLHIGYDGRESKGVGTLIGDKGVAVTGNTYLGGKLVIQPEYLDSELLLNGHSTDFKKMIAVEPNLLNDVGVAFVKDYKIVLDNVTFGPDIESSDKNILIGNNNTYKTNSYFVETNVFGQDNYIGDSPHTNVYGNSNNVYKDSTSTLDNVQIFGSSNNVASYGVTAIGYNNTIEANSDNSVVLGNSIAVTGRNSVALGSGTTVNQDNVVSVGNGGSNSSYPATRKIVNVADGVEAHDAATYGQTKGAIKALAVNGKTITYTKIDGTTGTITTQDTNTTYSNMKGATASVAGTAGLVPAPAAGKQNAFLRGDGTWVVPTDTNTHYTTGLYVGSGAKANAATTNGNTKIALYDDSTARNAITIKGAGGTTVTSDANGVITINSTDNNTTYSAMSADELNTGTATTSRAMTAKVLSDYVKGKTNDKITSLSVNGKVITYTKGDGTTGTITTQDTNTTYNAATSSALGLVKTGNNITNNNGTISLTKDNVIAALGYTPPTQDTNTTYGNMTASELETGSSTTGRIVSAKVLSDYITSKIDSSSSSGGGGSGNTGGSSDIGYDSGSLDKITFAGANGTKLTNVKQGVLSAASTDAVTGAQLYATNQNISGFQAEINRNKNTIRNLNDSVSSALTSFSSLNGLIDTINNMKADASLSNINATGKKMISNTAVEAVQNYLASLNISNPVAPVSPNALNVVDAGNGSLSVGEGSNVNGASSIAIGVGNQVNANNSGAFGDPSVINADASYVLGNDDTINTGATGSFVVGNDSVSSAKGGLTFGSNNTLEDTAEDSVALGNNVNVTGNHSVALGTDSTATEDFVVSVGNDMTKRRITNVATGVNDNDATTVQQLNSVRDELASRLVVTENLLAGDWNGKTARSLINENATEIQNLDGRVTTVENDMNIVRSTLDTKANSDASNIDVDAWTTKLGTGIVEDGNTGLVNGGTVFTAIQKIQDNQLIQQDGDSINIGSKFGGSTIDVSNNTGEGRVITGVVTDPDNPYSATNVNYVQSVSENIVNAVNRSLDKVDKKVNKVGANAAALASLTPASFEGDEKWSLAASFGHYEGQTAGAVGAFYKPTENVMLNLRGSFADGENMFGGGVAVSLSKGDVPGVTKRQLANEVSVLKQNQQALLQARAQDQQQIAELKAMVQQMAEQMNSNK